MCGGDWDRIEESYDLHRYHALQDHWQRAGPPAYVSAAAAAGFKGKAGGGGDDFVSPENLGAALQGIPGGRVVPS